MGSVVVTPKFYSTDSIVVAHGPSCSAACGTFPEQGSNTCLLHCQVDSLPLSHQGSLILYLLRPIPHCLNYYSFMSLEIRSFRTFNLVLFFFSNHSTHLLLHNCEDFFPVITVFVVLPGAHPQPRIKLHNR